MGQTAEAKRFVFKGETNFRLPSSFFRARNVCLKRLFETFVSKPAKEGGRGGPRRGGGGGNKLTQKLWTSLFFGQKLTFSGNVSSGARN